MGRFTSNVAILRSKFLNLVILKGALPRPSDIHDIVLYTGISCHNFLYKSLLRSVWLRRVSHCKQKIEIFVATRPPTWLKLDFCSWFQKQDKNLIKTNLPLILSAL